MTIDPSELAYWRGRIEAMLAGEIRRIETTLHEREKALEIGTKDIDRRLNAMNEIREQLAVQRSEFASADRVQGVEDRLRSIESDLRSLPGTLRSEFAKLEVTQAQEARLRDLETKAFRDAAGGELRRYLIPVLLTLAFLALTIYQAVH